MEEEFMEIIFCQVPHSFSAQSIAENILCNEQNNVINVELEFNIN